ncbi:Hypothetical predicted protein [Olea europaea subsp. europaea]|uniref:Uncharacterized protein n=1 Tax=Olea europaea subsp. europaea TaxID=158383 RepID=A0A8S0PD94_OLEEU|nr:Hypothetical predicted protein [Olea europaea subsp. europaea]
MVDNMGFGDDGVTNLDVRNHGIVARRGLSPIAQLQVDPGMGKRHRPLADDRSRPPTGGLQGRTTLRTENRYPCDTASLWF